MRDNFPTPRHFCNISFKSRTGPNNITRRGIAVIPQRRQRQFMIYIILVRVISLIFITYQVVVGITSWLDIRGSNSTHMHRTQGLWNIHWEKSPCTNPHFLKNLFETSLSSSIWTQGTSPSSRTISITLLGESETHFTCISTSKQEARGLHLPPHWRDRRLG